MSTKPLSTQSETTTSAESLPMRVIEYISLPGFSRLFLDTVEGKLSSQLQFNRSDEEIVRDLQSRDFHRDALADILNTQSAIFGSDTQSRNSIALLREKRAVVVIAGQQAGLYGGPMLSLIKGLAVAKAARICSERLRVPVVPIFWIAADDHDIEEIRATTLLNRSGQLVQAEYPDDKQRLSAGGTTLDDEGALAKSFTILTEALGEGEYTSAIRESISDSYRTGETFATAFGRLISKLTAGTGLVLFSPSDLAVKKLAHPWFAEHILKQAELSSAFKARTALLNELGYHIQVEKKADAGFIFRHTPQREAIHRDGESWKSSSKTWTTDSLLAEVSASPESFSPNVLTRPLLQSWLFPVLTQFGGPSEIAYLHQVAPMFETMNLVRPRHLARPGATLIDKRTNELLTGSHVSFETFLASDSEAMISKVLTASFPTSIQTELESIRADFRERASKLAPIGAFLDPQLAEFAGQTAGKIDYLIGQFAEKLMQGHRKKEKETRERWLKAVNLIAPNRGLQERTINVLSFIARYGPDVPKWIYDAIDPDSPDHRIVSI